MDPSSSLLDSLDQAATTRSPSTQDDLVHASTTIAPSEQVASQRSTPAPSEPVAPEHTMSARSAPAGDGATDKAVISIPRGCPSSTMRRLRAILQLELQPVAQVHPELQLQGNSREAQIIILLPGYDSVPVERCAPGRLVSTRSNLPFNS